MSDESRFYLLDGHAIAYRQFFGLRVDAFSTSKGEPTNAIFGFARLLLDLLRKEKPKYLAVSFDRGMSGREQLLPEYKSTREKMPDELAQQLPRIEELVRAFNIPILVLAGYEADDLIGTACTKLAEHPEIRVRIISGDRDLLQLVNERVEVQLPQRGGPDQVYDPSAFRERYDLEPAQLIDLKALMGDASDNIPGVRGIGQKTATKLLHEYGSLRGIYDHIAEIRGANQRKLKEGRELAFLSYELATIQRDIPMQIDLSESVAHEFDVEKVLALFQELEFRTLTRQLQAGEKTRSADRTDDQMTLFESADSTSQNAETSAFRHADEVIETVVVQDKAALSELVRELNEAEIIAWDVETTNIDPMMADLVGISLATQADRAYYIPVGHDEGEQLPIEAVLADLAPPLTDPRKAKLAYNANYDHLMLARYGLHVHPIAFDVMLAEWCVNPAGKYSSPLGLKALAFHRLSIEMTEIKALLGSGRSQKTMNQVPIAQAAPYAAADAALTHRLWQELEPELTQAEVRRLFAEIEMPLVPVIAEMEQAGIKIDRSYLNDMSAEMQETIADIQDEIFRLNHGNPFNINSPKQLNEVLFQQLQIPTQNLRRTTQGFSTDAGSLESLKDQHPIIEKIQQYREITKLKGTYVDALPNLVNPNTGRVHTSFNQAGSTTGRFSSSNPNLQNIPIRSEQGRLIRKAFVAQEGHYLLAVDYNQIELRVLAHVSQDEALIRAFHEGQDIHRATASAAFDIPMSAVDAAQRDLAKRVNFGLMYGMGANSLARESQMTFEEASQFIQRYFERLPRVREYIDETQRIAKERGELRTLFGRLGDFKALKRPGANRNHIQSLLRVAINFPIQGSAADIMKLAMLAVHRALLENDLRAKMLLQVHDELVLEVPKKELELTHHIVAQTMESVCELLVPLRVDAEYGPNWYDMHSM
ncbi:MAG: DNA polymerase I [Chloroflexi bacterium]|nr:DNA polymerase I [Chloroflexota bacterium]